MPNGKLTYFLVIFQAVFVENKFNVSQNKSESILSKLVNVTNSSDAARTTFSPVNSFRFVLLCEENDRGDRPCGNGNFSSSSRSRNSRQNPEQVRWTDDPGRFSSAEAKEMAPPNSKSAHFDLVVDDADERYPDYNSYKEPDDNNATEEDEDEEDDEGQGGGGDEEDDEYGFDLLESDDRPSKTKTQNDKNSDEEDDEDDEDDDEDAPQLKHLFKIHKLKMKDIMFLLLLAYKLKFMTLIPLLLGALILLVGTTSMAGFFFALFSAALGLQSKHR